MHKFSTNCLIRVLFFLYRWRVGGEGGGRSPLLFPLSEGIFSFMSQRKKRETIPSDGEKGGKDLGLGGKGWKDLGGKGGEKVLKKGGNRS